MTAKKSKNKPAAGPKPASAGDDNKKKRTRISKPAGEGGRKIAKKSADTASEKMSKAAGKSTSASAGKSGKSAGKSTSASAGKSGKSAGKGTAASAGKSGKAAGKNSAASAGKSGKARGKSTRSSAKQSAKTRRSPATATGDRAMLRSERIAMTERAVMRYRAKDPDIPDKKSPGIGSGKVRIIFLGGLEQIGMNITAFETEDSIVVVDCGMAFPDSNMPGVDLVIPDIGYLRERAAKLKGFFITHGHEDHIGALPYVLGELSVPVYATRLTRAIIELKLREKGLMETTKLMTAEFGDVIEAGDFAVEFIKTNHSIQDAAALAIHTPAGTILHTGDFKIDFTPVHGDTIDLQRIAELGKQGVLALLCDSTNAMRPGFTMSERTVGHTFDSIFSEYRESRLIIATFASNVDRVQQIISSAERYGRKVVIDGRSMVNVIGLAAELGYIEIEPGTLIDIGEIRDYPPEKVVLIVTGSQGEPMAALSRMAEGQHKKISLGEDDVIVLSSTPIPGNEKSVSRIVNELSRMHATIINQDTHVSGHACAEDIKLIYSLVHPRYAIPVHGEYRHRVAQRDLALEIGVPPANVILADTGDILEITADEAVSCGRTDAGPVLVDGLGVGDVGNIVLRDRQSLSQNGIIVAAITIERATGELIAGPDIVTRGLIYVRDNEDLIEEARELILDVVNDLKQSGRDDRAHIKNVIKEELGEFIWRRMKRAPVILPIISEA